MRKTVLLTTLVVFFAVAAASGAESATDRASICGPQGEWLYRKHCMGCHGDPVKLEAVTDIAGTIRNPPAPMPVFSREKISDRCAEEIASYIHQRPLVRVLSKQN